MPSGRITPKRLIVPTIVSNATPTAYYTSPNANTRGVIETISVHNPDFSSHTFDLWIGGSGDVNRIAKGITVAGQDTYIENRVRIIEPTQSLFALASAGSGPYLAVDGAEHDVSLDPLSGVIITPKRLAQGFIDDGGVTAIYTSPNSKTTGIIHTITIVNTDASPHDVILYEDSTGTEIFYFVALAAGARIVIPAGPRIINPTSAIYGACGGHLVNTITIDGAEYVVP